MKGYSTGRRLQKHPDYFGQPETSEGTCQSQLAPGLMVNP